MKGAGRGANAFGYRVFASPASLTLLAVDSILGDTAGPMGGRTLLRSVSHPTLP